MWTTGMDVLIFLVLNLAHFVIFVIRLELVYI